MIPRPPTIPASIAAFVTLGGLALMYWSLTNLGLLKPSEKVKAAASKSGADPNIALADTGIPSPGGVMA